MYVTQKDREKRKKVDVDIYLSNENFIKAYKTFKNNINTNFI